MFFKRNKNQVGGITYQHVSADTAKNIRLATTELAKSINELKDASGGTAEQPKIHELSIQPLVVYASGRSKKYVWHSSDREIVALLNKPNTRLAIIEDDEDETV